MPDKKEKSYMFFLHPHKNFDRIFEEYGVEDKVTPDMLDEWADTATEIFLNADNEDECIKRLIPEARQFGRRIGVAEEKLSAFTKDIIRTTLFYLQSLIIIKKMLEQPS